MIVVTLVAPVSSHCWLTLLFKISKVLTELQGFNSLIFFKIFLAYLLIDLCCFDLLTRKKWMSKKKPQKKSPATHSSDELRPRLSSSQHPPPDRIAPRFEGDGGPGTRAAKKKRGESRARYRRLAIDYAHPRLFSSRDGYITHYIGDGGKPNKRNQGPPLLLHSINFIMRMKKKKRQKKISAVKFSFFFSSFIFFQFLFLWSWISYKMYRHKKETVIIENPVCNQSFPRI